MNTLTNHGSTITKASFIAMLSGDYCELACTVSELIEEKRYQEVIQVIHYCEHAFNDEDLELLSEEIKKDTDEDLCKDSSGWYIAGNAGAKTIPNNVAMALIEE